MEINKIHCIDVLEGLKQIPSESIDCIVTSPPYWGLRDYGEEANAIWGGNPNCEHEFEIKEKQKRGLTEPPEPNNSKRTKLENLDEEGRGKKEIKYKSGFCKKCGAWQGQLGLEPTLNLFIEHLLQITAELKRVLKKTGVMFWNHGDCYGGSNCGYGQKQGQGSGIQNVATQKYFATSKMKPLMTQLTPKCLAMQNYRLILRMIDEQGWILRNTIIWHKPNHMPSSVKDRFTNAYEPVFMLTKSKKYWFDLDAVRVPYSESGKQRRKYVLSKFGSNPNNPMGKLSKGLRGGCEPIFLPEEPHPIGKNPGDVWKPYAVQERVKEWVEYRNLPEINEIKNYLNEWRKKRGLTIKEIEEKLNSQAPHHWFNGEVYPSKEDWIKLKEILAFDDKYDEQMTQTFLKPAEKQNHPLGKNPGDIWTIPTQSFPESHFAVYPEKLIEPMIKAGCPQWICKKCGKARKRIVEGKKQNSFNIRVRDVQKGRIKSSDRKASDFEIKKYNEKQYGGIGRLTVGWTDCSCKVEGNKWKAGIVLDPFMGSGTTALVAKKLGRNFIGIDINPKYCEMARKRVAKVPVRLDVIWEKE